MMRPWYLFAFLLFLVVHFSDASENWPGFRGPNYDGSGSASNFGGENNDLVVSWRLPAGSGYSGISVVDGKAVTAFSDGKNDVVVALDSKSGKELWRYALSPTYRGHDGSHDGPIATPSLSNGKVFAFSATGELAAIDLVNGKEIWRVNVTEQGGRKPFYGFGASPLVSNGVVVMPIGGEKGKAIAAFDAQNGKIKWSVGDDMVNYQSPIMMKISGRETIVAVSDKKMFLIDPQNGQSLLEYEHGGDDMAGALVPVPLDENRILLRNKMDSTDLVRITQGSGGKPAVEKVWTAGVFKNSYNVPVYHQGYLYGFNGRVLTCVDAATGETKWKSRGVGDGFLLLVNGHLVVQTKTGDMHVGKASPEGWQELKQMNLFKQISWTPPSFADGAIFTRSHGELARLEWSKTSLAPVSIQTSGSVLRPAAPFAALLNELQSANEKKQVVDRFFTQQKQFPIVEWPDRVTFVYRGEAEDVAIMGDLQGQQREESMQRVPGTDIFYYTARMEPDARIHYRYIRNYEENIADPHNAKQVLDRRGTPMSWFAMPGWSEPPHLIEAPASKRGTFEAIEIKKDEKSFAKGEVYLPAGYGKSKDSYPVLYLLDGMQAKAQGLINNTIENLSGKSFQPMIVVYITEMKPADPMPEDPVEFLKVRSEFIAQQIVPFVDVRYRTSKEREHRAICGHLLTGWDAFYTAFSYSDLFGAVATQSLWVPDSTEKAMKEQITGPDQKPMRIYMDWGLYDGRSPTELWDIREMNRKFYAFLAERGYFPAGGQTRESYGWPSWRNQNHRLLAALFGMW